jgi:CRISPR type III-A-associated protein Csm2
MAAPSRPSRNSDPPKKDASSEVAFTREDARQIIEQGDAVGLVRTAERVGPSLGVNPAQLRRFFGEVRRIEMLWSQPGAEERARRRAILLEPRLNYQVQRQAQVRPLKNVLQLCLEFATADRERFQRFVEFYEALIAYAPRATQGGRQ